MTTYEHLMLSMCFGAVMGWFIFSIGLTISQFYGFIKKKIKAHREKKHPVEEVNTDNE